MYKKIFYIIILNIIFLCSSSSQSIMNRLDNIENATFSVVVYSDSTCTKVINSSAGFFISSDGIGVAPVKNFLKTNYIKIITKNKAKYNIKKVISYNKYAGLVIFIIDKEKSRKRIVYLTSSPKLEVFTEKLFVLGYKINKISYQTDHCELLMVNNIPLIDLTAGLKGTYKEEQIGAPIVNDYGNLVGIAGYCSNFNFRYCLGAQVINDDNWVTLGEDWQRELKVVFDDIGMLYNKALGAYALEKWNIAEHLFSNIIQHTPKDINALALRAEVRRQNKNIEGMKKDFETAKKINGKYYLLHYFKGLHSEKQKHYKNAIFHFQECIKINQKFIPAIVRLGIVEHNYNNRTDVAMNCYNLAISSSKLNFSAYYERARLLLYKSKQLEKALNDINRVIELNRYTPGCYTVKGAIANRKNDFMVGLNAFNIALKLDKTNYNLLVYRGVSYYNLGYYNKACSDWQKAAKKGSNDAVIYLNKYCK